MSTIIKSPRKTLDSLLAGDKAWEKAEMERVGQFATWCACCKKNTYTGLYPTWHSHARHLCGDCGTQYANDLKAIGAWPSS